MSSRTSRLNVRHNLGPSPGPERMAEVYYDRSLQSSNRGQPNTGNKTPCLLQAAEYSPLHMRLLNCPGGTCPSMAMRLEMELEYAERRAKFIRKSQCHYTRWNATEAQNHREAEGGLVNGRVSPVSDTDEMLKLSLHRSPLYRTNTATTGGSNHHQHQLRGGKRGGGVLQHTVSGGRRITSSDAVSDDVSTCAGTGSLQSVGGVPSPLSSNTHAVSPVENEILPLTRCPRRRVCVPKPRARPATDCDRLCPPRISAMPWSSGHRFRYSNKRASELRESALFRRHGGCPVPRGSAGIYSLYAIRAAAGHLYSPGREQWKAAICPQEEEPRATLKVTRVRQTASPQQVTAAATRLRRTSFSTAKEIQRTPPSILKMQPLQTARMPSLDNQSMNSSINESSLTVHKNLDRSGVMPVALRREIGGGRKRRLRRFRSCTSVQILRSLVKRQARKLVGPKVGSHSVADDFGSVETEADSATCSVPRHNSSMLYYTSIPHTQCPPSYESASPRLTTLQAAVNRLTTSLITTSSSSASLSDALAYRTNLMDFETRPLMITDSEGGEEEEEEEKDEEEDDEEDDSIDENDIADE